MMTLAMMTIMMTVMMAVTKRIITIKTMAMNRRSTTMSVMMVAISIRTTTTRR